MNDQSPNEIRVILPGASAPVKLPAGWSLGSEPRDVVTIVCPEGDLRVAFLVVPHEGTPEEIADRAWREFDSSFDFPVLQKMPMPGAGGWTRYFKLSTTFPSLNRASR